MEENVEEAKMPLLDHLVELRQRLLYSVGGFLVCFIGAAYSIILWCSSITVKWIMIGSVLFNLMLLALRAVVQHWAPLRAREPFGQALRRCAGREANRASSCVVRRDRRRVA